MLAPLLVAAVLSPVFVPEPEPSPDPPEPDLKNLQGTWERTSYTQGGAPVILIFPDGGPIHAVVSGNRFTYTQGAVTHGVWSFTLDPRKKPKSLDKKGEGAFAGTEYRGIYSLEGDTLILCEVKSKREEDRPKDFKDIQPSTYRQVFRRVKR